MSSDAGLGLVVEATQTQRCQGQKNIQEKHGELGGSCYRSYHRYSFIKTFLNHLLVYVTWDQELSTPTPAHKEIVAY